MRLVCLTLEYAEILKHKKVIFFEKNYDYIRQFADEYLQYEYTPICIVDDYKRNQGVIILDEKQICIKSSETLLSVDWSDTVLVITSDYYEEAYEKIIDLCAGCEGLDCVYYFLNNESKTELFYKEKYVGKELKDIIVFRSGPHASSYVRGTDFADNARALFEYMISHNFNRKYRMIWLVKNPDDYSVKYTEDENVEFISFDDGNSRIQQKRDRYYEILFSAKYLFFTDAYGFVRNCKKEQVRVQLWHGCGFKTRTNFVPCEKRYDFMVVPGPVYKKIHSEIFGLREEQVLITGLPKVDWLFHPATNEMLKCLGISQSQKIIFWLPTFRKAHDSLTHLDETNENTETGLPIFDSNNKLTKLNEVLKKYNIQLIIKLHPFQKATSIQTDKLSNIIMLENETLRLYDVQINQLLGCADALISDYSSAAIDFLLVDRPMAFTLDDVEQYTSSRGFVFDNILDWIPGEEIWNEGDFFAFIEEISEGKDVLCNKRSAIKKEIHTFFDDGCCERVVKILEINLEG